MNGSVSLLEAALDRLIALRPQVQNGTKVLEEIIAACSQVMRQAERVRHHDAAASLRNRAPALYSSSKSRDLNVVRECLERSIMTLHDELRIARHYRASSPLM